MKNTITVTFKASKWYIDPAWYKEEDVTLTLPADSDITTAAQVLEQVLRTSDKDNGYCDVYITVKSVK